MVIYWFVKPQRKAMRSDKMFIELIDDTNCGFNPTPKIYTEYAPIVDLILPLKYTQNMHLHYAQADTD